MTIGERIKRRRKELKLSVDYVAKKLGKNRATVYRYESDEIEDMSINVVGEIAKVLKVDPGYLMGWKETKDNFTIKSDYPIYAISAGVPIAFEAIAEYDAEKISIPDNIMGKHAGNKNIFIMRTNGESMNRVIPDQSLIAVKPVELSQLKNNDIVVYNYDGEYAVKRFYRQENKVIFRPDSNDMTFTDLVIDINDCLDLKIKGKVVLYIVELD